MIISTCQIEDFSTTTHNNNRHNNINYHQVVNSCCARLCPLRLNESAQLTTQTIPLSIGTLNKRNSELQLEHQQMANITLAHLQQSAATSKMVPTTTFEQNGNNNLKLVSSTCIDRRAHHYHNQHYHHYRNHDRRRRDSLLVSYWHRKQASVRPLANLSSHLLSALIIGFAWLVLVGHQTTIVSMALASPNALNQLPIFSSGGQFSSPAPSLCPLVPACQCKWSNGKQGASCERRNLADIPNQLSQDTQVLNMSGNNLNQLAPHIFQDKHLTNLQRIFLSECKISYIADEAFAHLTNLIELDLSHNYIQQVPAKSFEQLNHSLRKLNLAFNPIQEIESDAFSTLTQLSTLDLSNCQLSTLKQGAFHGLNQLKELKLHDNHLTQLPIAVMSDLKEYLIVDLFGNPWHCDCELRQSIDWMSHHHIQQSIVPICSSPQRHKDIRWHIVKPEEFICPPVVINKQNELIVGAGSNVSLACTARGSPPLTFVWFQDEKNLTIARSNQTDPPASTKLLEEKRYEIAEEIGPPGHPNITTSILYLFNLKLTDTSLFLCWVENAAGYTIANFSLIVNDSPPATLTGGSTSTGDDSLFRSIGLSEVQMGIVSIGFVIVLVAILFLLVFFKHSSRSSKSSQSSDLKANSKKSMGGASENQHAVSGGTLSASSKFNNSATSNQRSSILAESEDDCDNSDDRSSGSGSSCRKSAKVMATGDLDGFIEHMRSGIINMDYHSMSPVIQFNNTLKSGNNNQQQQQRQQNHMNQQLQQQQQQKAPPPYLDTNSQTAMHHFPSGSNASSLPYYTAGGNGSASMTTTTSDLSPGSGSGASNTNFANNGPITNCDLQHQLHQQQQNDLTLTATPPTNTTTTSYTSDYQSGYGEDPATSIVVPPIYPYVDAHHQLHHHHQAVAAAAAAAYHQQQYQMQMAATMRGQGGGLALHPEQPDGQGSLVLQDMMIQAGNNRGQPQASQQQQQRLRMDPGFHFL